jgi:biotin carboxyl carrier protein
LNFQAGAAGTVKKIHVKKGQKIDGDDLMLEIE